MAARRWLLFGLSLSSLLAMTFAGVSLAFSLKVTPDMAEADPDAKLGTRMVIHLIGDPAEVRTLSADGDGDLVVTADAGAAFVARAQNVSLARALAYATPDTNGTYAPATFTGRANATVNVSALAAGGTGWIVQAANEEAPRFVPAENILGEVVRFENATLLPALFIAGVVGFLAPLVAIVVSHRGGGPRSASVGNLCPECRAPMAASAEFCVRCGAYARQG